MYNITLFGIKVKPTNFFPNFFNSIISFALFVLFLLINTTVNAENRSTMY
jgi:hypothetical protein